MQLNPFLPVLYPYRHSWLRLHFLTVLLFEICMWKVLGTPLCSLAAKVCRLIDITRKMFNDLSEFWKISHISDLFLM